jgi:hypothetical protein
VYAGFWAFPRHRKLYAIQRLLDKFDDCRGYDESRRLILAIKKIDGVPFPSIG